MRIMQLHTHYRRPGGEDAAVDTEAGLLRRAGHDVELFTATNPDGGARSAVRLAAAPWNPAAARMVQRAAERFRPDVAHVHNTWFSLSPAVLGAVRRLDIPIVMTLHNYRLVCAAGTLFRDGAPCRDCVGTTPWHAVAHDCYRDSKASSAVAAATIAVHSHRRTWHRDVDRFLALTEFGRRQFIDGGLPADRIAVKSNSVPDPGPRPRPPSASRTVVFIGRLTEEKGLRPLLAAWRSVPDAFELVVVGDGPLAADLRRDAPDGVRFVGRQSPEAVAALLLDARALIFPSIWYEGQGLVALEAAAAGVPVFLSDLGAMSELFAPDLEAFLLPPGDADGIADRLRLLADATAMDDAGALHRARFEQRYTHEVALERLEAAYAHVRR